MVLRERALVVVCIVSLAACGNDDVGISGTASASGTGDDGTFTDTDIPIATMTSAEGSGGSGGSESSSSGAGTDSASTGPAAVCGDDAIGEDEVCDGSDLGEEDCASQGFASGTLACLSDCSGYDVTGCLSCGNDAIDGDEACDGTDLAAEDCVTQGFDGGALACAADCTGFDTAGCFEFSGACCEADDTPGCDDAACTAAVCAADASCCSGDWDAGCAAAAFDEPACMNVGGACPQCGDGAAEGGEACDGSDLAGEDCVTLGLDAGSLRCADDCTDFDLEECIDYNGDCCAPDDGPGCDDGSCTASVCAAMPSCCDDVWSEACAAAAFDDPACNDVGGSCPVCGDDVAEGSEACDGTDLLGDDCTAHGFDGGTLQCAADCSALDLSTCADIGFGDCVNNLPADACLASEQCVTDLGMPPLVGVCADVDCTTAADCPLTPPGGTSPVVCVDVTGEGINECILFCGMGQTCPTGMQCELGLACAWPAD
jgi:hypothetical protein